MTHKDKSGKIKIDTKSFRKEEIMIPLALDLKLSAELLLLIEADFLKVKIKEKEMEEVKES